MSKQLKYSQSNAYKCVVCVACVTVCAVYVCVWHQCVCVYITMPVYIYYIYM